MPSDQIPLSLPLSPPDYSRGAFISSHSNESALKTAMRWVHTTEPALVICGPASSGKTHLAHILVGNAGERAAYHEGVLPADPTGLNIVDGLPGVCSAEELLKLYSETVAAGGRLVLVGEGDPETWSDGLVDLRTRLAATMRATLDEPDEALLKAVIGKLFRDRQLAVSERVISYAAPRLQRTFDAANRFVTTCDQDALASSGGITLKIAQNVVAALSEESVPT